MTAEDSPHAKHSHVYAIIRVDEFHEAGVDIDQRVTVTKVMMSADDAADEVRRLNSLREKAGGRSRYFSQPTRLVTSDDPPHA